MARLIDEINAFTVPAHSIALWFLGQNGWILKLPSGFTVAIDPGLWGRQYGRARFRRAPARPRVVASPQARRDSISEQRSRAGAAGAGISGASSTQPRTAW